MTLLSSSPKDSRGTRSRRAQERLGHSLTSCWNLQGHATK